MNDIEQQSEPHSDQHERRNEQHEQQSEPTALERALAGYRPLITPPRLAGAQVVYAVEDTAVGRILLAARADGTLLASSFAADDDRVAALLDRLARWVSPSVLRGGQVLDRPRRELTEYLAGRRRRFEVPVDLALATPFQRLVLGGLTDNVGYGHTTSYGRLATALGRPSASRAVGAALAANPLCVVLPCHRVLASTGALTGYAGGVAAKRLLLDLEAAGAAG